MTYRSPPLWFSEGLAEYWSSGWDSKSEMVIRDALLNDYLIPLNKLDSITFGFLLYKEGQSFLRFVDSTYGQDKILLILEGIWKDSDFYKVIESVIGKNFNEILSEWMLYNKKEIYPLLETEATKNFSKSVTRQGINGAPVYFSSDSSDKVIFLTNRTGYSDIYIQELQPENQFT